MRYVIAESFDKTEINRAFNSNVAPKIGRAITTRNGKWYRITDVAFTVNDFDRVPDVHVLLARIE